MTNDDLYQAILRFLRKDRRSGVLTELEFEKELQRMNTTYMDMALKESEIDKESTDRLVPFKEVITGASLTMVGDLITRPVDYARHEYLGYRYNGTDEKEFDELTGPQWNSRIGSSVSAPTEMFPVCRYRENYIEVRPSGLTKNYLEYGYIRYPVTPYYDGYYTSAGNFVYLGVGASHLLTTGEVGLRGQVAGATVVSVTIELEWHEDDRWIIGDFILRRMGVVIKEPLATQFNDQIIREK